MSFNKKQTVLWLSSILLNIFSSVIFAQQINGKVKDLQGKPIVNATVLLVNGTTKVQTDEQGLFVLDNLPLGDVELHVTAKNYSHKNHHVDIKANSQQTIELVLTSSVIEVIDVYATPLHSSTIESALPVNVIASDELRSKQASTLGETLKNEVGVHSTYYGPVASSPIIRGLDGPRVMITQNGLNVGDASRVGPDHVVSSETATAQQIEVLRGPATLFYGSGAIGGVVNVVDSRVPTSLDNSVDYMVKHNDVASEDEASFALNASSGKLAFHVDGFWRDGNDYKIPGYAESADAHHEEEDHEDEYDEEEHDNEASVKGVLPNSAAKSSGFTIGTSYLLDNGFVGFSFGNMSRTYGIPGHSHEESQEEHDAHEEESHDESVYAELEQDRIQMLSELTFDQGFINKVSSKASYTDYKHKEIEGGAVGTIFNSEMIETRFDIFHQKYAGWKGAWTFHYTDRDFEAVGEEAFTPASDTTSYAFAWLEENHLSSDFLVQLGLRVEHVEIEAVDSGLEFDDEHIGHDEHEDNHYFETQSFTPVSLSTGLVWDYQEGYNLGFSLSYSQRAPSAAELFSNGAHIGTNSYELGALYDIHFENGEVHFELGDQDVKVETAKNIDITWRKYEGDFGFVIGAFYNQINDYYYQFNTGLFSEGEHEHEAESDTHEAEEEGLPVYIYQQSDVAMYGIEAEFVYQWNSKFKSSLFTDYVKADLDGGGNLPRIPPMRIGAQLNYQEDSFSAQLSATRYFEQNDVAELETETDGYTMIDANLNYYVDDIGDDFVVFVKVNNLTDQEARVHTSFLKDLAPLPARGFEVGIRGGF